MASLNSASFTFSASVDGIHGGKNTVCVCPILRVRRERSLRGGDRLGGRAQRTEGEAGWKRHPDGEKTHPWERDAGRCPGKK